MGQRLPCRHSAIISVAAALALLLLRSHLFCQEFRNPQQQVPVVQNAGEAEIAFQGYYLGSTGQSLADTTGASISFREFVGGFGLISANLENYGSQGSLRTGENFFDLQQLTAWGQHWRLTGGDFRTLPNQVENPFDNVYTPEIAARGFRIEMSRDERAFGFFIGEETLQEGPRITFRVLAPQDIFGLYAKQKIGDHFQIGVRYLHFSSGQGQIENNPFLFPIGRQFLSADTLQAQSTYAFTRQFKLYGEATMSHAKEAPEGGKVGGPGSVLFGPAYASDKLTIRSNYTYQTASYFPLLGYFAGDRKGVFAETTYRVKPGIDFSVSASHYSNNLANDPEVSDFRSTSYSFGSSLALPWKLSAGANFSVIKLLSSSPTTGPEAGSFQQDSTTDRQLNLSVSRSFQRHNLRLSLLDLTLDSNATSEKQHSLEFEDTFQVKGIVLGGAVRMQAADSTQSRDTVFFRGSAQVNLRHFSAYGYTEIGNDILSQSLFSTNSYRSTVLGASAPIAHGWSLQAEVFRNQLNTTINEENIFVMQSQGIPISNTLSSYNQWSTYFRFAKHLHWGAEQHGGNWENYAAVHNPLVGSIEGKVEEQMLVGNHGVEGIPVSLDGTRVVVTEPGGHYRFSDVPEGAHRVALDMQALPAEFETGTAIEEHVKVEPRGTSRADLNVFRLTSLTGKISAPKGIAVDNVVVRISSSKRYTTPAEDGNFGFYNLREGDYELTVDEQTIPEGCVLLPPSKVLVSIRLDSEPQPVFFEIGIRKVEKPVRVMIEQKINLSDVTPEKKQPEGHGGGFQ